VRVAAVQMSSQAEVGPNLARMRELVARAATGGARMVLLPENFAYLGDEEGKRAIAESIADAPSPQDGPVVAALREAARAGGVWLVAGGMAEKSDDALRPYNTCAVFDPAGRLCARYRKIHLFDVDVGDGITYRESAATSAGGEPAVARVGGDASGAPRSGDRRDSPSDVGNPRSGTDTPVAVGLSVCYDLRFPELYRRLVDLGAQLLVVPAAFTLATGKDHWLVLLRARAIESQCWLLAAGQWGKHGKRNTFGKSCLIDPWGEIVAQASEGEGVVLGDVDLGYVEQVRAKLPSLRHRVLK
jgi:deaminated glutathione amidase